MVGVGLFFCLLGVLFFGAKIRFFYELVWFFGVVIVLGLDEGCLLLCCCCCCLDKRGVEWVGIKCFVVKYWRRGIILVLLRGYWCVLCFPVAFF